MSDFTSRMYKLGDKLSEMELTLEHLGQAFSTTGNFHMADNLHELAAEAQKLSEEARSICGDEVAYNLKLAQEQSRATTDLAMRIIKGEITLAKTVASAVETAETSNT